MSIAIYKKRKKRYRYVFTKNKIFDCVFNATSKEMTMDFFYIKPFGIVIIDYGYFVGLY